MKGWSLSVISVMMLLLVFTAWEAQAQTYADLNEEKAALTSIGCDVDNTAGTIYEFDICLGNKKIGDYTTVRFDEGTMTRYCAESVVNLWLFGDYEVRYTLDCAFEDSFLLYSTCVGYRNGKEKLRSEIIKSGDQWTIIHNDEVWIEERPIKSTVISLYYEKPVEGMVSVVESTVWFKNVYELTPDTYQLREPKKRRSTELYYLNDRIERINVHFPLLDFNVVRKTPGLPECTCAVDMLQ